MLELILPWPNKDMSPNSRVHHMQKASAKKHYRANCHILAKAKLQPKPKTPDLLLIITFNPPHGQKYDRDNCLASIKAGLDGVADALGADDADWSQIVRKGVITENGSVHVQIMEKLDILADWEKVIKKSEATINDLQKTIGIDVDGPLIESIHQLQTAYTKQVGLIVDDQADWLGWYWLENEFGQRGHKFEKPKGKKSESREIRTLADLFWVIS